MIIKNDIMILAKDIYKDKREDGYNSPFRVF
jgi:hypothetical protein